LNQKYLQGLTTVSRHQIDPILRFVYHAARDIRFKRHCGPLYSAGVINSFVSRETIHEALSRQCLAAFLVRFSESQPGQFVISYVADDPVDRVRHYLVKPEEIGSNKSLPDFIRDTPQLQFLLVVDPETGELRREHKDDVLGEFYVRKRQRAVDGYTDNFGL